MVLVEAGVGWGVDEFLLLKGLKILSLELCCIFQIPVTMIPRYSWIPVSVCYGGMEVLPDIFHIAVLIYSLGTQM